MGEKSLFGREFEEGDIMLRGLGAVRTPQGLGTKDGHL